ncbi:acyltransferase family protein [Scleromatobacter humisilvae]|uniref:Acyltransferase n=1 Tax=Scleromatobacter humisilvae TaxID=2897159 RepID=A0A9X2C1R2_9BURK|nr:acyltransferase [Scleromatobacter humisilvae]MCK9689103.1 acyltransferase [Scleromatobacter humisilvae]
MHHSFIWSHYAHGLGWRDSEGFRQFGESRVVLFFMLTTTLFYGRLIDSRGRNLDWLKLYVSRLLRLGPAYWFAMCLMIAAVTWATLHHVDQAGTGLAFRSWTDIFSSVAVWMGFSMLGMPAIDAYFNTPLVTAAVTWTLPYEITFYMLLPLLALPLRVRMPATTLALGLAAAIWLAAWAPDPILCLPFVGGMAVAMLVRIPRVVQVLRTRASAAVAMAAMTAVIFLFPTAHAIVPMLLLAFAMAVVAADNDLFGILSWRAPQALGNWAYSLYLLHGIVLYTLFMLVIGAERAAQLTTLEYIGIIAAITPVVLTLAWASQRWIESPPMRAVPVVVATLRKGVARLRGNFGLPVAASRAGKA